MTVNQKLKLLRAAMAKNNIEAYLVPSGDAHKSEYVAQQWKAREWISGFSGSAGIAIITQTHAGVWTDSRYFLQAETELADSEFVLHKQGIPHAPEHNDWLRENLPENARIGCDGRQFSLSESRALKKKLAVKNIEIITDLDLVGAIWQDRPLIPAAPIFVHETAFAGKSRAEKLAEVRAAMTADYYLITALDEVAWLFNLRGKDVDCNPVFYAYAVVGREGAWLFTPIEKVSQALKEILLQDNISLKPYTFINSFLEALHKESRVQCDISKTNVQLCAAISPEQIVESEDIIENLKAIKNETEIAHTRHAMVKDGVALTHFFMWLEKTLAERSVAETEVAEVLAGFRSAQADYHNESFDAIVGYKGNGAIIHYRAEEGSCAYIEKSGILLLDSGGQYTDGTTDITRTIALDEPTEEQKFCYTCVLKGYIELSAAVFPAGTRGAQLDTLARMHLWQAKLNYGHGTGHGVGFFLNVHEGPQGFAPSPVTSRGTTVFHPGMITSNEPGFYRDGEYGIRIENLILCVEAEENTYGKWLKFEDLTLFPIDTRLIQVAQMTKREKKWLNTYHKQVYAALSVHLDSAAKKWLKGKTKKI